jgi:hypothetical protein
MNYLTRKFAMESYFRFLNALPHIGPNGLSQALQLQVQCSPLTIHHLALNRALDPNGEITISDAPVVSYGNIPDGHLQFALVSKSTFSQPKTV